MVTATNLQGRLEANAWRRDGGGKTGKHGAQNENLASLSQETRAG
jgi:hypothetical protein